MSKSFRYIICAVVIVGAILFCLGFVPTIKNEWGFKRIALSNMYSGGYMAWSDQEGKFIDVVRLNRGYYDNSLPVKFDTLYNIDKCGIGHIVLTNPTNEKSIRNILFTGKDDNGNTVFTETELISFDLAAIELTCNGVAAKHVDAIIVQ